MGPELYTGIMTVFSVYLLYCGHNFVRSEKSVVP